MLKEDHIEASNVKTHLSLHTPNHHWLGMQMRMYQSPMINTIILFLRGDMVTHGGY